MWLRLLSPRRLRRAPSLGPCESVSLCPSLCGSVCVSISVCPSLWTRLCSSVFGSVSVVSVVHLPLFVSVAPPVAPSLCPSLSLRLPLVSSRLVYSRLISTQGSRRLGAWRVRPGRALSARLCPVLLGVSVCLCPSLCVRLCRSVSLLSRLNYSRRPLVSLHGLRRLGARRRRQGRARSARRCPSFSVCPSRLVYTHDCLLTAAARLKKGLCRLGARAWAQCEATEAPCFSCSSFTVGCVVRSPPPGLCGPCDLRARPGGVSAQGGGAHAAYGGAVQSGPQDAGL